MPKYKVIVVILLSNIIVAALSGGLTALLIVHHTAAATPSSLAAREFVLVDQTGHIGAKLSWENHQPGIRLFDSANHVRSAIFLESNGVPDLYLYDENNAVRAALNLFDSGVPNLAFLDAAQENMVWTDFDKNHSYNISFVRIGKDANRILASRRMTAHLAGIRTEDKPEDANSP